MYKLFLDTTVSKQATVKVFSEDKLLAEVTGDSSLLAIKEALEGLNLTLDKIDRFEANPGPGSYTGLRVGATVINTLNWAFKKPADPVVPIYG